MGRKSHAKALAVWVNGTLAGEWRIPSRSPMEFQYDAGWLNSSEARPLSLSLPLTLDPAPIKSRAVESYFENLLPDSESIRKRIQMRFQTASSNVHDLLAAVGRDCIGAVQLLAPGEVPADVYRIDAQPLTQGAIEEAIDQAIAPFSFPDRPAEDEFRISIAGAQEKTAFLRHGEHWCLPRGATPTTHIFKLPLGLVGNMKADMSDSIENEWLCSKILAAYGLPVAHCDIGQFGARKVLIVQRFDRQLHSSGAYWLRLVQEDFCQATATPSYAKYESEGGPGLTAISKLLGSSLSRDEDLACLLKAQLLFWMLAATDGHAKNFSIRILPQGRFHLTPLYDVLSAWPIIGNGKNQLSWQKARLAMALQGTNKHYRLAEIQRRHFNETAARCGLGETAEPLIEEILSATPRVISHVREIVPAKFPETVLEPILDGLARSAKQLKGMPA